MFLILGIFLGVFEPNSMVDLIRVGYLLTPSFVFGAKNAYWIIMLNN